MDKRAGSWGVGQGSREDNSRREERGSKRSTAVTSCRYGSAYRNSPFQRASRNSLYGRMVIPSTTRRRGAVLTQR